uniref:Uncharacterized protein n=1 Tax=Arundo donax TaxID=35708 RepID=A0A0A9HIB5_ARUDO
MNSRTLITSNHPAPE